MIAQHERTARVRAKGGQRLNLYLTPEATAALKQLRERGAKSDAAAVNAAVRMAAYLIEHAKFSTDWLDPKACDGITE